jgi:hypothetical protein
MGMMFSHGLFMIPFFPSYTFSPPFQKRERRGDLSTLPEFKD